MEKGKEHEMEIRVIIHLELGGVVVLGFGVQSPQILPSPV